MKFINVPCSIWMCLAGIVIMFSMMAESHPVVEQVPLAVAMAVPSAQTQQALRGMRLIPQWHCLRYRKFDVIRRCRNYRAGRRY